MTAGGIASDDASLLAASVGVVVAAAAALVADVVLALRAPKSEPDDRPGGDRPGE